MDIAGPVALLGRRDHGQHGLIMAAIERRCRNDQGWTPLRADLVREREWHDHDFERLKVHATPPRPRDCSIRRASPGRPAGIRHHRA
ncbi:hypothetical protein MCP1_190073 [Candidatus Terasakiella magnetica]|nr:hypothetical protein MCP1_190073 [Candidatus Terasakiella magnetica]